MAVTCSAGDEVAQWTALSLLRSAALFFMAGVGEIGGGWLIWQCVREHKPWWWAVLGALALIGYGFVLTQQPEAAGTEFGRMDAAYGGVFIGMSFLWGRIFDKMRLDLGDLIGSVLCLAGVIVILGWPRGPSGAALDVVDASANASTNVTFVCAHQSDAVNASNASADNMTMDHCRRFDRRPRRCSGRCRWLESRRQPALGIGRDVGIERDCGLQRCRAEQYMDKCLWPT